MPPRGGASLPQPAARVTAMDVTTAIRTRRTHKQYGADPVDSGTLIEGALKGIQAGATAQGVSPLDVDMLDLMTVRVSRDPDLDWTQFAVRYDAYLAKTAGRLPPWPIGQAAAKGMLDALNDPNSTYLDAKAVEAEVATNVLEDIHADQVSDDGIPDLTSRHREVGLHNRSELGSRNEAERLRHP